MTNHTTTEPLHEAVLPCPFCGGRVGILIETDVDYADCTVMCLDCSAQTFARAPSQDETHTARDAAVAEWNRRAIPTQPAVIKPLEWELRAGDDGPFYVAYDPLYSTTIYSFDEDGCEQHEATRSSRILASIDTKCTHEVRQAAQVLLTALERAQIDSRILKIFYNGELRAGLQALIDKENTDD